MLLESRDESFSPWRARLHEIIFEADTPAGQYFDIALIVCILLSTLCVMLDSVRDIRAAYSGTLNALEWVFTLLFTVSAAARCEGEWAWRR